MCDPFCSPQDVRTNPIGAEDDVDAQALPNLTIEPQRKSTKVDKVLLILC